MKKTIVSLAAAAALTTGAFAADKGIDIVTTGQAVAYYQTSKTDAANGGSLLSSDNSSANVGIQLNLAADLKNNFSFGSQLTYLGTAGLERTVVDGTRQGAIVLGGSTEDTTTNDISLTKIFVAKKIANTTVKLGRQELPKSLSIVLIGSHNGVKHAQQIVSICKKHSIYNFAGELSIMETTALISKSQLLICADGGLMHIAHGVQVPTLALFATVNPKHFTTATNKVTSLFDEYQVSNISYLKVTSEIKQLLTEQRINL